MAGKEITTVEEWSRWFAESMQRPVLVMKHSTRCPVSADAYREFEAYLKGEPRDDVAYIWVKVIESRAVSDQIAADLKVKHASPQAILIQDGQPVWDTSHWHITQKALEKAVADQVCLN